MHDHTGSIGRADICLLGQIGAVLTGVGEAVFRGRRLSAKAALAEAGLRPVTIAPRDSLASISIDAVGYAAAAEALRRAASTVRMLMATGLATAAALGVSRNPWRAVAGDSRSTLSNYSNCLFHAPLDDRFAGCAWSTGTSRAAAE